MNELNSILKYLNNPVKLGYPLSNWINVKIFGLPYKYNISLLFVNEKQKTFGYFIFQVCDDTIQLIH